MERESRARKSRSHDAICFHAQQCAEKYLKARLCEAGREIAKIHDLVTLLEQALLLEPAWEPFLEDLAFLSDYAVAYRYPGVSATKDEAASARTRCRAFRQAARLSLGLKP